MSSPNIVNVSTITGLTTYKTLANGTETVILNAPVSTNEVIKVNNVVVANTTSTSVNATVSYRSAAAGAGTAFKIANSTPISAYSTLVLIDKSSSIYLEENTSLTVTSSSASGLLDIVCSYEKISW